MHKENIELYEWSMEVAVGKIYIKKKRNIPSSFEQFIFNPVVGYIITGNVKTKSSRKKKEI